MNEDDFERRRARTRKVRGVVGIVVLIVAAAGGYYAYHQVQAHADRPRQCIQSQVKRVLDHPRMAAYALSEVCTFPDTLQDGLRDLDHVGPDRQSMVIARMVADNPALLLSVCMGGARGMSEAMSVLPEEATAVFLEHCDLSDTGIGPAADLERANLYRVLLATVIYGALRAKEPELAPRLARYVAFTPMR